MRMVETIGRFFEAGILGLDFSPEPALSFEFDSNDSVDEPILAEILAQLIFYGAVVPHGESRFRLAHTFAPLFKLPLRKGRPVSLQGILVKGEIDPGTQLRIEGEGEN